MSTKSNVSILAANHALAKKVRQIGAAGVGLPLKRSTMDVMVLPRISNLTAIRSKSAPV